MDSIGQREIEFRKNDTNASRSCLRSEEATISELLKYGKGSDRLKNRVCDVLGIDETWVDLGE